MIEKIKTLWNSSNTADKEIAMNLMSTLDYSKLAPFIDEKGLMNEFPFSFSESVVKSVFGQNFVIFCSFYGCLRVALEDTSLYNGFVKNFKTEPL